MSRSSSGFKNDINKLIPLLNYEPGIICDIINYSMYLELTNNSNIDCKNNLKEYLKVFNTDYIDYKNGTKSKLVIMRGKYPAPMISIYSFIQAYKESLDLIVLITRFLQTVGLQSKYKIDAYDTPDEKLGSLLLEDFRRYGKNGISTIIIGRLSSKYEFFNSVLYQIWSK